MRTRLQRRVAREEGFTLIELLVVIVIIGILLAIAVPSFLGFRDRANEKAAASDVRAAIPATEAYFSDCGTYSNASSLPAPSVCEDGLAHVFQVTSGATPDLGLKGYDSGIKLGAAYASAAGDKYCLWMTVNSKTATMVGPGGTVKQNATVPAGGITDYVKCAAA